MADEIQDVLARAEHPEIGAGNGSDGDWDHLTVEPQGVQALDVPVTTVCDRLKALQRRRRFCIKSQSRCDRSVEAMLADEIGLPPRPTDWKDKVAKAAWQKLAAPVFAKASAFRKSVEKGGEGRRRFDDHSAIALSAFAPFVLTSALARAGFDKLREDTESEMRRLAKSLPVYAEFRTEPGFGEGLVLAVIVAECGNSLSNFATKEKVWKRLGLAVVNGKRQQRCADPVLATLHGFNPERRAEIWAVMMNSVFRHQWAGERDEDGVACSKSKKPVAVPAHAKSRYGEVYARRRAATAGREEWSQSHQHADGVRIMTKQIVEDIWKTWRRHDRDVAAAQ